MEKQSHSPENNRKSKRSKKSKKRKKPPLPTPHDSFFLAAMAIGFIAQRFFKCFLSPDLSAEFDWSTLSIENSTFVNNKLRKYHSDVIFSVQLVGTSILVYLIVEQQTKPLKNMSFRVYHYLFNLIMSLLKQRKYKKLPSVHAMVFYTGKRSPYPYSMKLTDCFDEPPTVMGRLFHGEVELVNANVENTKEMRQVKWLGPMVQAMASIRMPDITDVAVQILRDLAQYDGDDDEQHMVKEFTLSLLTYFANAGKIKDREEFFSRIERLPNPIRGVVMTFGQELRKEGWLEGLTEGKEQGLTEGKAQDAARMLAKGYSIDEIHDITLLSIEQIETLKNVPAQNESHATDDAGKE